MFKKSTAQENDTLLAQIGLVIMVFCIAAFASKAAFEPERLARYSWPVVLHGVLMVVWLALFPLQAWLMSSGRAALHRLFGRVSVALAIALVVSCLQIAVSLTFEFRDATLLAFNSTMLISFSAFFVAAVMAAILRHTGLHRRLMLFTTLALTGPAVGRVFDVLDMSEMLSLPVILGLKILVPLIYDFGSGGLRKLTLLLIFLSLLDTLLGVWLSLSVLLPFYNAWLLS